MKDYYYLLEEPHFEKAQFGDKTLETCSQTLDQLEKHRQTILHLFIHDYHMVRIDLSVFKSVFLERVRVHKEYLLEKLEHQLTE